MKILLSIVLLFFLSCTTVSDKPRISDEKKASSHYNLGLAKFSSGDLGKARRELEIAIKYAPNLAFYHNHLGLIYMAMNDYKKAEKAFKHSYKIDKTYTDALNTLGVLKLKQGKLSVAKKLFIRVLEDPIYPWPQYPEINLGIIARLEKQYEISEKHFLSALNYKRNECTARKEMGKLFDDQRLTEKAAFNYTLSLKYCRNDVETLYRSAVDYMLLKREAEGLQSLKRCMLIAAKQDDPFAIPFMEDCLRLAKQYGVTATTRIAPAKEIKGSSVQ
ncbi:tetratricopeptide repeat protein [bacterium]|nr:tetratricopeptide repeat protein [bacterium]